MPATTTSTWQSSMRFLASIQSRRGYFPLIAVQKVIMNEPTHFGRRRGHDSLLSGNLGAVTHERQKFLLEGYNFKCASSTCSRYSKVRARSDDDRPAICIPVNEICAYYREMVYDWITRGGNDHSRLLDCLHTIGSL